MHESYGRSRGSGQFPDRAPYVDQVSAGRPLPDGHQSGPQAINRFICKVLCMLAPVMAMTLRMPSRS